MTFHKGKAADAVFESSLPALQKLLMLCYIKHANHDGIAWPGGDRLARLVGVSISSVKRHRAALMKAGVLVKVEGGEGSVYRFVVNLNNLPTGVTETPVSERYRYQSDTSTGVREIPVPVSERAPNIHKEHHTKNITQNCASHSLVLDGKKKTKKKPRIDVDAVWSDLMQISEQSKSASHRLKLTAWRRSMVFQRVDTYSPEEVVHAWKWWNESTCDRASYLRKNRGPAGIDTFLRRSNHDKYQAFSAEWTGDVMEEPGPDASIAEMREWLNYKNREFLNQ